MRQLIIRQEKEEYLLLATEGGYKHGGDIHPRNCDAHFERMEKSLLYDAANRSTDDRVRRLNRLRSRSRKAEYEKRGMKTDLDGELYSRRCKMFHLPVNSVGQRACPKSYLVLLDHINLAWEGEAPAEPQISPKAIPFLCIFIVVE